jgi:hypothetical protein
VPRLYSREAALPLAAQTEDAFRDPWKGGARAEVARKKTSSPLCSTLVVARTASRLSVARKVKNIIRCHWHIKQKRVGVLGVEPSPSLARSPAPLFFFPFSSVFLGGPLPCCRRCVCVGLCRAVGMHRRAAVRWWMERKGVACRAETSEKYSPRGCGGGRLGKQCFADASTAHVNRMKSNYRHHYLRVRR